MAKPPQGLVAAAAADLSDLFWFVVATEVSWVRNKAIRLSQPKSDCDDNDQRATINLKKKGSAEGEEEEGAARGRSP